jgi:hypothetical protein
MRENVVLPVRQIGGIALILFAIQVVVLILRGGASVHLRRLAMS